MNTKQISSALKQHPITKQQFVGVFPLDRLPATVQWPGALVVNTDPHDQPGEHWLAIYIDKQGRADYFDSYGREMDRENPFIVQFIARNSTAYRENLQQLQAPLSSTCGQYCVYFIMMRCLGHTMERIQDSLLKAGENTYLNDEFVTYFVNKNFNLQLDVYDDEYIVSQLCKIFNICEKKPHRSTLAVLP